MDEELIDTLKKVQSLLEDRLERSAFPFWIQRKVEWAEEACRVTAEILEDYYKEKR